MIDVTASELTIMLFQGVSMLGDKALENYDRQKLMSVGEYQS